MTLFGRHTDRAIFKITGPDRVSFLQGVLTNDLSHLPTQKIQYALMLTPQGRFHFEAMCYDAPDLDAILIDTPADFSADFYKRLRIYKLRADVTIEIIDGTQALVVTADTPTDHGFLHDPRHEDLGYRGIVWTPDHATFPVIDQIAYEQQLLSLCIPRAGFELIPEKTIPLEANMETLNALSFDKGCYLGQELTTRTKHQGLVRKQLYTVLSPDPIDPAALPLDLYVDDKKAGALLSFSHNGQKGLGIAKLRTETIASKPDLSAKDPQTSVFKVY